MCYDGGPRLLWSGVDLQESEQKKKKKNARLCVSREDDEDEMEAQEID